MASLSPLNSPSTRRSLSPTNTSVKTPSPAKVNLTNVTVRRTAKKKTSIKRPAFNAAPTPVLNRSSRGRLVKPRLAPGERIVYDCYGSPIEARKSITITHITNRHSDQFVS